MLYYIISHYDSNKSLWKMHKLIATLVNAFALDNATQTHTSLPNSAPWVLCSSVH